MKVCLLVAILLCLVGLATADVWGRSMITGFNSLNFTFPNAKTYQNWLNENGPASCMPAGIKIDAKQRIFVSVPRWSGFVPATLNMLVTYNTSTGQYVPVTTADSDLADVLLMPFPSWEMNTIGDASALQSVLGFEIDAENQIMYILDQGKVNFQPAIPGSIKLIAWDLNANQELFTFTFTSDLADPSHSFMNDVVLDKWHNYLYMTDSGLPAVDVTGVWGGLVVLDMNTGVGRRLLSQMSPVQPNATLWIHINGEPVNHDAPNQVGADGIALMPGGDTLFFCALTSHKYYSVPTSILRNESLSDAEVEAACTQFDKGSASDGLAGTNSGLLFATSLEGSGIHMLSESDFYVTADDPVQMRWPDTMGFDHQGALVFVSNQLNRFTSGELVFNNASDINFRIWSLVLGVNSYLDP